MCLFWYCFFLKGFRAKISKFCLQHWIHSNKKTFSNEFSQVFCGKEWFHWISAFDELIRCSYPEVNCLICECGFNQTNNMWLQQKANQNQIAFHSYHPIVQIYKRLFPRNWYERWAFWKPSCRVWKLLKQAEFGNGSDFTFLMSSGPKQTIPRARSYLVRCHWIENWNSEINDDLLS